jgi:hypothetical protein
VTPSDIHPLSFINDIEKVRIVIGVLLSRLGGDVLITQDNIDAIAYSGFEESLDDEGLRLTLWKPRTSN